MNAKDEQVSRSYINLLSRWQLINDHYVKIHQIVPSLRTVWCCCDKLRQLYVCFVSAACRQLDLVRV